MKKKLKIKENKRKTLYTIVKISPNGMYSISNQMDIDNCISMLKYTEELKETELQALLNRQIVFLKDLSSIALHVMP